MNLRIYQVTTPSSFAAPSTRRLVRAASLKQALKHCTQQYEARIPSMEEYGDLLMAGVKVEEVDRATGSTGDVK